MTKKMAAICLILMATTLAWLLLVNVSLAADTQETRPRARDIGIHIGIFAPGKWNAITDVEGVKVGHVTLIEGEGKLVPGSGPVRTGVTAILPHDGSLFKEKVPAAAYVLNAFGKSTGLQQVNELGNLETPIILTNTLNVPLVADALIEWSIQNNPLVKSSAVPS
jgi:D-aminopeptidase